MFLFVFSSAACKVVKYILSIGIFHCLSLEAGHSSSHDLIHQQQVGGNHGAAVDHLLLHSEHIYNKI